MRFSSIMMCRSNNLRNIVSGVLSMTEKGSYKQMCHNRGMAIEKDVISDFAPLVSPL